MRPDKWDWLMFCARMHAHIYQERARVVAVELPVRSARRRGVKWAYVIDAPKESIHG